MAAINVDGEFEIPMPTQTEHTFRSEKISKYPSRIKPEQKRFIAWDGEGMDLRGPGKPQSYVLFGCSTGDYIANNARGLHTRELLDFIIKVGRENPDAYHVGFAFKYDVNMIVRSLSPSKLKALYDNNYLFLRLDGRRYGISLRSGKSFTVTQYHKEYSRKNNYAKTSVTIFDIFGFFGTSFIKAAEDMLGVDADGMDIVKEGKKQRGAFDDAEYVKKYWDAEIDMLARVAEELRRRLYGANLKITQWYGPGAIGTFALRLNNVKQHKQEQPESIREAARYAYAGGRFELYKVGRINGPIYSIDINSAYPFGITQLPSMSEGEWEHETNPKRIAKFGVYRVRLRQGIGLDKSPAPLFHRDKKHNISYPWHVEGWYWSPEIMQLRGMPGVEILEGWHYTGYETLPFHWVHEMYEQRRQWKQDGNASQMALKLCLNSLYGKMAQRVGYDEKTGRIPPWHQLEWAGWVTSQTRATLFSVMKKIPWDSLIAVETDGIYTLQSPQSLGIVPTAALGSWSVDTYDEMIYVQSGLAWLRKGDKWFPKRRGLDPDSFILDNAIEYTKSLEANTEWKPFTAKSTRFIGLGAALMSTEPMKVKHCLWETKPKEIAAGEKGKRVHVPKLCSACRKGLNAYDAPHDLIIRSMSRIGEISTPHNIPWEGEDDDSKAEWRDYIMSVDDLIADI